MSEHHARDLSTKPLGGRCGLAGSRIRQQRSKVVPAKASDKVLISQLLNNGEGHGAEHIITR